MEASRSEEWNGPLPRPASLHQVRTDADLLAKCRDLIAVSSLVVDGDLGLIVKHMATLVIIGFLLVAAHPLAQSTPPAAQMPAPEAKAAFLKLLDRPRVPLDVKSHGSKPPFRGVTSERVDFAVEKHPDGTFERVPALIVKPEWAKAGDRMPAVIVLHGTGGRKEGNWPWLERIAHRGIVAIAIDGRYHGERAKGEKGTKAYNDAIIQAWHTPPGAPQAHPFYYDTCWDIWRTIDYLQARPDVDPDRIGMIGISKGGIETWLAGAVDERVKVAVPAISVQSFRWSLDNDRWQGRANTIKDAHKAAAIDLNEPEVNRRVCRDLWTKVIPGILDEFDCPSMLRLFAGRSLLVVSGERDPNCPIEGAELAFAAARAAFHEVDADHHLKIMVAKDTGHSVASEQQEAAIDWFVAWLKPTPPPAGAARYYFKRGLTMGPPAPGAGPRPGGPRPQHPRPSRRPFGRRYQPTPPTTTDGPPAPSAAIAR